MEELKNGRTGKMINYLFGSGGVEPFGIQGGTGRRR